MNKAITDGLVFMPPKFRDDLDVWSTGDGRPGSPTFDGSAPGSFVTADGDFNGCLEVAKAVATLPIRHMGITPVLPGCYLRVRAKVKAVSGALPSVRIAATPLQGGNVLANSNTFGPAVTLGAVGRVTEVSAIIGTGRRDGVDMVWPGATGAHIGLDLTGASGSVVRIDDIEVEDVSNVFLSDMIGAVDVRDFGAIGDGQADCHAAFSAADDAAQGREIFVPEGTYRIGGNLTIKNPMRFQGRITQERNSHFIIMHGFDYNAYLAAFKDEEEAFKKSLPSLDQLC